MLTRIRKHNQKIIWISIFLYIIFFCFLSLKKYYAFSYNASDLAIFNQVFFNSSEGHFFEMTYNLNSYLADHFTPIIFLLLPFYYFWKSPEILLILQSVIIGLSAWPLYKITSLITKEKLFSILIVFMWLFNPFVHNANLYEFHLLPFAIFFIFWTFYYYQKRNFLFFIFYFILAFLVREDIVLALLGFSFLAFFQGRSKKWKISPLLSLIYFFIAIKIVGHHNEVGNYKFLLYYNWLGGDSLPGILFNWLKNPLIFLAHVFSWSNIYHFFITLLPLAFLPLFSTRYLLLSLLPLLQFVVSRQGINATVYGMHYSLLFLAGFFIASIFGLVIWSEKRNNFFAKYNKIFYIYILLSLFYFSFALSPAIKLLVKNYDKQKIFAKNKAISMIDSKASLIAESGMASNLSSRQFIFPFDFSYFGRSQFSISDFQLPDVDYVLLDNQDMFFVVARYMDKQNILWKDNDTDKVPAKFREFLENYDLIFVERGVFLWKNKNLDLPEKNYTFYEISKAEKINNSEDIILSVDYFFEDKHKILKIDYQKTQLDDKYYMLRFYRGNDYYDLPIDYSLWPMADWPLDNIFSFYYYLDKDIYSYQLFSWQGQNKLGNLRQATVKKQIYPESGIISFEQLDE